MGLEATTKVKSMPEMTLKIYVLGWLIAARSGHDYFADYHERFRHKEEEINCKCGQRRSKSHPLSCSSARSFRVRLFIVTDRRLSPQKEVLGTARGIKIFVVWVRDGEDA